MIKTDSITKQNNWINTFIKITNENEISNHISRLKTDINSILEHIDMYDLTTLDFEFVHNTSLHYNLYTQEFFLLNETTDNLTKEDLGLSFSIEGKNLMTCILEELTTTSIDIDKENTQSNDLAIITVPKFISDKKIIKSLIEDANNYVQKYYKNEVEKSPENKYYRPNEYWFNEKAFEQYSDNIQVQILSNMLTNPSTITLDFDIPKLLVNFNEDQQGKFFDEIKNGYQRFKYYINLIDLINFTNIHEIAKLFLDNFIKESSSNIDANNFEYDTCYFKAYNDLYPQIFKNMLQELLNDNHSILTIPKVKNYMKLFKSMPNVNENKVLNYINIKYGKNIVEIEQYNDFYIDFVRDINQLNYSKVIDENSIPFLCSLEDKNKNIFINKDSIALLNNKIFSLEIYNDYQNDTKLNKHLNILKDLYNIIQDLIKSGDVIVLDSDNFMENYDIVL